MMTATYLCDWVQGYGDCQPRRVGFDYFDDANGFSDEDRARIQEMLTKSGDAIEICGVGEVLRVISFGTDRQPSAATETALRSEEGLPLDEFCQPTLGKV